MDDIQYFIPNPKYTGITPAIHKLKQPNTPKKQLEAELWSARLGFPSDWQMIHIPKHIKGILTQKKSFILSPKCRWNLRSGNHA